MDNQGKVLDCILAVEPEIGYGSIMTPNMLAIMGGRAVQMSPHYLYAKAQILEMVELGMEVDGRTYSEERAEYENLYRNGLGDIAEAISYSRIRFSMLLDTAGGPGLYQANVGTIKNYVNRSGGDFAAYGGVDIHSLGANLLMMAPKGLRFAHPLSSIMFHLGTPDPSVRISRRDQSANRRENKQEIRDLLLSEASPEHRVDVLRLLNETLLAARPKTADRRVVFSGKIAENWGMLSALDAQAMATHLLERHQLPSGALNLDLIRNFFLELGSYQKNARQEIGRLMAILGNGDGKKDE